MPLINFFVVFAILSFDILKKCYVIVAALLADIILFVVFRNKMIQCIPSVSNIIFIAIILVFRSLAEKYNYKRIPTSEVKKGMIMSFNTILLFKTSRVKGLPLVTTEDFRTRITDIESDSIKRWENSKNGQHEITIVRKLPFAVFITLGTVMFLIIIRWGL